jgi:hypothetical protein
LGEFIDKFIHDHLADGKKIDTFNIMEQTKQPNLVYTFQLFRAIINDSHKELRELKAKGTITYEDVQHLIMASHQSILEARRLQDDYAKSKDGKKSETDLSTVTFLQPIEIEMALKSHERIDISPITISSDLFIEYVSQFVEKTQSFLETLANVFTSGQAPTALPLANTHVPAGTTTIELKASAATSKPAEVLEEIPSQANVVAVMDGEVNFEEFDNFIYDATPTGN